MLGPKGIVGHAKEDRRGTGARCGREFGHAVHAKYTKKDTTKQEILMVAMLTGGHTGYK